MATMISNYCCSGSAGVWTTDYSSQICSDPTMYNGAAMTEWENCNDDNDGCGEYLSCDGGLDILDMLHDVTWSDCSEDTSTFNGTSEKDMATMISSYCCSGSAGVCTTDYSSQICSDPTMYNGAAMTEWENCDEGNDGCGEYFSCDGYLSAMDAHLDVTWSDCSEDTTTFSGVSEKYMATMISSYCCGDEQSFCGDDGSTEDKNDEDDSAEDENDDGPDDGALEIISDTVSDYWSITKELFKDLWSQITG